MVPCQRRSRRPCPGKALLAIAAVVGLAAGCASPEEPTARRPVIPQAVQDVQARQQGAAVVLSFTLPSQSTRNEPLAGPPAVEIYRGEIATGTGAKPIEKTDTRLVYTIPSEMMDRYRAGGRIVYRDEIEAGELARAAGTGAEWIYLVRTRAARNRAAAESNRVAVRVHASPETVSGVSGMVSGQSVTITWPRAANAEYRIYRAEITPESAEAASVDASKAVLRTPLAQVDASQPAPVSQGGLQVQPAPVLQYHDESVEFGHAYLYIVRRVTQYGGDAVESADSIAAVMRVVEAVPPSAPQDVEIVVVPAATDQPGYVSLSWALGSNTDVTGYSVYRSEQDGVRGVRLNEALLGAPTYRDGSVAAGRRYFYSVTAVNGSGVESVPSPAVEAAIPAAQP